METVNSQILMSFLQEHPVPPSFRQFFRQNSFFTQKKLEDIQINDLDQLCQKINSIKDRKTKNTTIATADLNFEWKRH